jgi:hypothetical protein
MGFDEDFTAHAPVLVKSVAKSAQHTPGDYSFPVIINKIEQSSVFVDIDYEPHC